MNYGILHTAVLHDRLHTAGVMLEAPEHTRLGSGSEVEDALLAPAVRCRMPSWLLLLLLHGHTASLEPGQYQGYRGGGEGGGVGGGGGESAVGSGEGGGWEEDNLPPSDSVTVDREESEVSDEILPSENGAVNTEDNTEKVSAN